jgi:hypothetical protein
MGLVRTLLQSGADVIVTDMATQPPPQPWSMLFSVEMSVKIHY